MIRQPGESLLSIMPGERFQPTLHVESIYHYHLSSGKEFNCREGKKEDRRTASGIDKYRMTHYVSAELHGDISVVR